MHDEVVAALHEHLDIIEGYFDIVPDMHAPVRRIVDIFPVFPAYSVDLFVQLVFGILNNKNLSN